MSILICGDLVPTKSNEKLFESGDKEALLGDKLAELMQSVDYRIANLETPLADECSPIMKAGPNLIANTSTVAGIKTIGIDLLTLANNHILDQGLAGLNSTRKVLLENGISFSGAGNNIEEAKKPFYFQNSGKIVGVFACAEHEFSIATENVPGAYGFDFIETFELIQNAKEKCDYLIVLYHGGKEYYRYPSPMLQKTCRKFVDKGADLVVCQHSHCIGCKEEYNSGTIVYGQGNFLFDLQHDEFWNSSLLIRINDDKSIDYIPIVQNNNTERLADSSEAEILLNGFFRRSSEIAKSGFVERKYHEFAAESIERYLFAFSGKKKTIIYRLICKMTGYKYEKVLLRKKYNVRSATVLENFIECEAHRELLLEGIKVYKCED